MMGVKMKHVLLIVMLQLSLLIINTFATPFFHVPNQGCSLASRLAVCLPKCVRDVATECIGDEAISCASGYAFCEDGQCHKGANEAEACQRVASVCSCFNGELKACARTEHYLTFDGSDTALAASCSHTLNTTTLGVCEYDEFAVEKSQIGSLRHCVFLLHLVIVAYGVMVIGFAVSKAHRERFVIAGDTASGSGSAGYVELESLSGSNDDVNYTLNGYVDDSNGNVLLVCFCCITFAWIAIIIMLIREASRLQVKSEFDELNVVFVYTWHASLAWLLAVKIFAPSIRNFFRIRAPMANATTIQIWQRDTENSSLVAGNSIVRLVRYVQDKMNKYFGGLGSYENETVSVSAQGIRSYEWKCRRFTFDASLDAWKPVCIEVAHSYADIYNSSHKGLSNEEAFERFQLQGPNRVTVKIPSFAMAIATEFFTCMYIYQLQCIWVWLYVSYWGMALIHGFVIVAAGVSKAVMSVIAQRRVRDMAKHDIDVSVYRHETWMLISAESIVPGDVIELHDDLTLPFDAVLCEGSAVVDQSSLTGESVPQPKWPLDSRSTILYVKRGRGMKHTLLAGTIIVQQANTANEIHHESKRSAGRNAAVCVVVDTGANTSKGELIRDLLYPVPLQFTFDVELRAVFAILLVWSFVAFWLSIYMLGRGSLSSWFYGIFTLGLILEPVLPAYILIGQSVAARRLAKQQLFCRDLSRIIASAKIRVFALDKTGTITKQGLRFAGVQPIINGNICDVTHVNASIPTMVTLAMASAHTLQPVENARELVGHAVDKELFGSTNFTLRIVQPQRKLMLQSSQHKLEVIRTLEFESSLMRMVSVVRQLDTNEVLVFCKGSYESIASLVPKDSLPSNFNHTAVLHAREGCYTLALAGASIGVRTDAQVAEMSRDELETSLMPLALVLFQNEIRSDSRDAITELRCADVRCVMLTGDNVFTGVYAAREAGMLNVNDDVLLGDVITSHFNAAGNECMTSTAITADSDVSFVSMKSGNTVNVRALLEQYEAQTCAHSVEALSVTPTHNIELALTRRAFIALYRSGRINRYLHHVRIFGRLHPEDKVNIVRLLQRKVVVGMCGDGGNDCGALQIAHAGIALSDGDASIAAPFTSTKKSLRSCVELIRLGRAALATDVALFKNVVAFGEIMFFAKVAAYYFTIVLPQAIWVFVEGPVLLGLSWALSLARPSSHLQPRRPTARLLGPETLASTIGCIFINAIFIAIGIAWLYSQDFMHCHEFDAQFIDAMEWWKLQDNYEGAFVGLVAMFQCLMAPALFNIGGEHRARWRNNRMLVTLLIIFTTFAVYLLVADPNSLGCFHRVNCGNPDKLVELGYQVPRYFVDRFEGAVGHNVMPLEFRVRLLGFIALNSFISWMFQELVVCGWLRTHLRRRLTHKRAQNRLQLRL